MRQVFLNIFAVSGWYLDLSTRLPVEEPNRGEVSRLFVGKPISHMRHNTQWQPCQIYLLSACRCIVLTLLCQKKQPNVRRIFFFLFFLLLLQLEYKEALQYQHLETQKDTLECEFVWACNYSYLLPFKQKCCPKILDLNKQTVHTIRGERDNDWAFADLIRLFSLTFSSPSKMLRGDLIQGQRKEWVTCMYFYTYTV